MITQAFDLNLIPGGVKPVVKASQYDASSRTLSISLFAGVSAFPVPSGAQVLIQGTKQDGTGFQYECTAAGNIVTAEVAQQMTVFAGPVEIELQILSGGEVLGTGNFILQVEQAALADDTIISETDIPIIQRIPEYVAEAQAAAEEAALWNDNGGDSGSSTPGASNNAYYWAMQARDAIDEMIVQSDTGDSFALVPTSAGNALATTIYGMSTQDGTPTTSTPVAIDSASADFKFVGKNNLPYPWYETTHTEATIPFTDNGDGSFTVGPGTASAACRMYLCGGAGTNNLKPNIFGGMKVGAVYSGSTFDKTKIYMYAQPYSADYSEHDNLNDTTGEGITIPSSNRQWIRIALYVTSGTVISSPITVRPYAIYPSVSVNPFEPYKHTDITTSLTLRSVEVTSSDPYNLVKDGHYYVADTIDWDEVDGYTLTQRIAHREYDGTEDGWAKTSATYADAYSIADSDASTGGGSLYYGKCTLSNMFIADANGGQTEIGRCSVHDGKIYFSYATYNTTTLSDWKTFLGSNPLVIDFIKIAPTKTSLTSAQAKALLSMRTYDESTSIDAVNAPAPVLALEYAKTRTPALALTGHNMAHINAIDIGDL